MATLEHLVPQWVGGADDAETNLVVACLHCNQIRGNSLGPPETYVKLAIEATR
jgi:hypothetical protein